nr:eukaryotic translation initiation factor eif-1 [Quercus suber]
MYAQRWRSRSCGEIARTHPDFHAYANHICYCHPDPFAEADEDTGETKQSQNYIHIRIQQRNGRKTLTTVQGLPKKFDQKKILKVIKKKFACNGTIVNDSEMGEVIQLQGDQRKDVQEFLVDKKEGLELDAKTIKTGGLANRLADAVYPPCLCISPGRRNGSQTIFITTNFTIYDTRVAGSNPDRRPRMHHIGHLLLRQIQSLPIEDGIVPVAHRQMNLLALGPFVKTSVLTNKTDDIAFLRFR